MTATLNDRMKSSKLVVEWVNADREAIVNYCVAKTFAERAGATKEGIQHLTNIVDDYIDWLWFSLDVGCPIDLNQVKIELLPPLNIYAIAFENLNNILQESSLPNESKAEGQLYLQHLISWFKSKES